MRLEQEFQVAVPADRVWAFLLDVPTMAACIPGASNVTQTGDNSYDAVVKTKIGPVTANFGCKIVVLDLNEATHSGAVEVSGRDGRIGGGVKARMDMTMTEAAGETSVRIVTDVDVLGKIGQYGHGMIAKRADAMFDDFVACARARLT
ncbi:MAG: SRPBCC family protein [Thermomicrobiales bacterium]|nr:SRPBCC family protein [Thermomicrobiales bacterium]